MILEWVQIYFCNQNGGGGFGHIFDVIVQVVAVVVVSSIVGTAFQTGFEVSGVGSDGLLAESTSFGQMSFFGSAGQAIDFLPMPVNFGGGGGNGGSSSGNDPTVDHTAPNLTGTTVEGGTVGDTHTIYDVGGQTTVSESNVKMGAILSDPTQPTTNSSQYTDNDGNTWKTAKQLAAEHDQYLQNRTAAALSAGAAQTLPTP